MHSVMIPDEIYERLVQKAALMNLTVDQLIPSLLGMQDESMAQASARLSREEWQRRFNDWMAQIDARAPIYPSGFKLDDSREAMYEGCGE